MAKTRYMRDMGRSMAQAAMERLHKAIEVGDEVCYTAAFCRNTGQQTGPTPFLRGKVISVAHTLQGERRVLEVHWEDQHEPYTMNVMESALIRVSDKHREAM